MGMLFNGYYIWFSDFSMRICPYKCININLICISCVFYAFFLPLLIFSSELAPIRGPLRWSMLTGAAVLFRITREVEAGSPLISIGVITPIESR